MKQLVRIIFIASFLLNSGCGELIFSQTGNAKQGQTYEEYKKEQKEKEEEWRLHQTKF